MSRGRLIGIGVGPGDPELVTLKAVRALGEAEIVAYFAKKGGVSNARATIAGHLRAGLEELALVYPMTTECPANGATYRQALGAFYDRAAETLAQHLENGRAVAVICEGDPLFYGSYMHLHVRLAPRFAAEVVPGVTGMSGCWSSIGMPMAQGADVFAVVPATLPQDALERRLADADAVVVMKLGRHLPKVRRALARVGRLERAIYVERGTMPGAAASKLSEKLDDEAPYFSVVLVPGWEERA